MDYNSKRVNALIKRKGLVKELRERGIKRISSEGERELNKLIFDCFEKIFLGLKEEMEVSGKRVLDKGIVEGFIAVKNKKEEIDY